MARQPGGDPNQVDRPNSTSTLSHPVGSSDGPQSAQASNDAAVTAVTGHPDQEIQTGKHQPATADEARKIVDGEVADQLGNRSDAASGGRDGENDREEQDKAQREVRERRTK